MAVWSKRVLSGSTNGRGISISSSEPGTTIHTVSTATQVVDNMYILAHNKATTQRMLVVNFGGTATTDYTEHQIPPVDGFYSVVPGLPLNGATGVAVYAYATSTGSVLIWGYVDRAS